MKAGSHGVAVLSLVAALGAQQRQHLVVTVGTVADTSARAVAGASVMLVEDDPDLAGIDPVHFVEAVTDERGRFVVPLQRGVRYTALAAGPERDGAAWVAQPRRGVGCGVPIELALTLEAKRRRVELPSLDAWGARGELRVELRFRCGAGHAVDVPLGDDGAIELPPLAAVGEVWLLARDGAWLCQLGVPLDPQQAVLVPTPVAVAVVAVDERGEPVEGALVRSWHVVSDMDWSSACKETREVAGSARTDRDGRATLRVPRWGDPFENAPDTLVVTATKPGFAECASGWACREPFAGWKPVARHSRRELRLPMQRAEPPSALVVDRQFAGRMARLFVVGLVTEQQNGMRRSLFVPRSYDLAIAADGTCAPDALPPDAGDVRLLLPPLHGRRVVTLPSHLASPPANVGECERAVVQVLDEAGGPAPAATVLLVPAGCTGADLAHAPPIALDRAARAEVLLQRGRWVVLAQTDTAWAIEEPDAWPAAAPVTVRLAPKPSMRVRVVNAAAGPVAGARFEAGEFRNPRAAGGRDAVLSELGWNTFAEQVRRAVTDAAGEATIRWLPWPGATPTAFAWQGDWQRRSDDFRVAEADDVVTVRLR